MIETPKKYETDLQQNIHAKRLKKNISYEWM